MTEMAQRGLILPVYEIVVLPHTAVSIHLSTNDSILVERLRDGSLPKVVGILKHSQKEGPIYSGDFEHLGVSFQVRGIQNVKDGYQLSLQLLDRVALDSVHTEGNLYYANFTETPDLIDINDRNQKQILDYMKKVVSEIAGKFPAGASMTTYLANLNDINTLIVTLSPYMKMSNDECYELLKTDSLKDRSLRFLDDLMREKESVNLNLQVKNRMSEDYNKIYREQVLREQMKAIQDELGEGSGTGKKNYEERIKAAGMPPEIEKAALEELDQLKAMQQGNPEESVLRNHLDFMLKLPWKKEQSPDIDLDEAKRILDADHYGLDKVKERILQHLAVMKLKENRKQGSILLLVGPPGTGKTSLGKSIAKALDRKYVRLSLGGIRDEAEIRGHRKTYVGAMPGRILEAMKNAGTTNPVMVLDEVDKLQVGGYSGDPSSALLEVLDPEQNNTFEDHYLDLPYDLSNVFFLATANSLDTIPQPLLDRMEVVQISSYTAEEKFHIAKEHLLPEVREDIGLSTEQFDVDDDALREMIEKYTVEAGVRGLRKQIETAARVVSKDIVMNRAELPVVIHKEDLEKILGHEVMHHDVAGKENPAGVVTGLAWTAVGGEILFIEAVDMPGNGNLILTGKLGDVMKESARISLSLLKSRLPQNAVDFSKRDIHIHVPSGAIEKDGPSAGITLFTALASLFTGIEVDPKLAMTGEVTLRGTVLPIGGLKEKLLGAQRAGIKKVLIPRENLVDLKDMSPEVLNDIEVVPVDTVDDVLREALHINMPAVKHSLMPQYMNTQTL